MKKEVKYYEYYCDRCGEKVHRLYGPENGHYLLKLNNVEQSQAEECRIIPAYYLRQNGGRNVDFSSSGICLSCLKEIMQYAINTIESKSELNKQGDNMNQEYEKIYYITYYQNNGVDYRIIKTTHNPDTCDGLISLIQEIERDCGDGIVLLSWKRLEQSKE